MADYIKREDAIDTACSIVFSLGGDIDDTVEMETSMEEIPAADVRENVNARWIDMGDHLLCSGCGATHYGADKNFCPSCGADMREEDDRG